MNTIPSDITATSHDPKKVPVQSTELEFENLTETEREVLLAMLVAESDQQAIRLSPVKERQFYTLKKKLSPLTDQISTAISRKSWHVLVGSTIRAAQVMAQNLDSPSTQIRLQAAKDILNRVLGEPTKRIEQQSQITVLGIKGMDQTKIDALLNGKQHQEQDDLEVKQI